MTKSFITNKPALEMTLVGFGQAGSRIVDVLAKYQTDEGIQTYNCLALNSNDGDLKDLRNIDPKNRVSLELGGLGKNPEKAEKILNNNEKVQAQMKNFVSKKIGVKDDLVIFFAGLGGGTGTSTIIKAIEDFHEHHNKPKIKQVLQAMITKFGEETYKGNETEFNKRAFKIAEEQFVKIGVVACLPVRNDGPDVLRQVNKFAQKIWALANDPTKGISFIMFPDNQFFHDVFKGLPPAKKIDVDNYRDYANLQIAETIHEINTAANQGGTSVVLDAQDLKRAWTEHKGCLVLSKQELPSVKIDSAVEIANLFQKSLTNSNLHEPLELLKEEDGKTSVSKVHHVGLLATIDYKKDYGNGSFIESATDHLHETLPINGTVFSGFVKEKNEGMVTVYSFYKADALPGRLSKGLLEEYNEFIERNKSVTFASTNIEAIEDSTVDSLDGLTLEDLGLSDLLNEEKSIKEKAKNEDIIAALNEFDFNF